MSKLHVIVQIALLIVAIMVIIVGILSIYPFKVVYLQSPHHRNPYVEDERIQAEERLNAGENDRHDLAGLLQAYHVRYVLTMPGIKNAIAVMCSNAPILESPEGYKLYRLNDNCANPELNHQSALARRLVRTQLKDERFVWSGSGFIS